MILLKEPCGCALKVASKLFSHLTDQESKKENLELPLFDLPTIATATNNFSNTNMIGAGGFGYVYKVIYAILCIRITQKWFQKKKVLAFFL